LDCERIDTASYRVAAIFRAAYTHPCHVPMNAGNVVELGRSLDSTGRERQSHRRCHNGRLQMNQLQLTLLAIALDLRFKVMLSTT
jgi:hypothetical protein